jgi:hypothetical protein
LIVKFKFVANITNLKYFNVIRICFRTLINIFLCITQLGFCCVYFVFVSANLHDVVKHYFFDISVHWYLLMLLVPMILLNFVKSLKYLTPASLFASILTCSGLIITFFYMLQDLPNTSTVKAFSTWSQLPLYFGTAIYAFEGIGVVSLTDLSFEPVSQSFQGFAFGEQHEVAARLRRLDRRPQHRNGNSRDALHRGGILRLLEVRRSSGLGECHSAAPPERAVSPQPSPT